MPRPVRTSRGRRPREWPCETGPPRTPRGSRQRNARCQTSRSPIGQISAWRPKDVAACLMCPMHLFSVNPCNWCIEVDLRQLRTFVVVAEAGGFAAAQQQLRLSQPAASRQIQALEGELGIPLFDRVGRGIKLTSEGEDLLRRGRRLLQDAESFGERARALRTGKAGTLRVGCSNEHMETVLAAFLPAFRRRHPSVDIELIEDGGARVPDRLPRGDVHLALMAAADDAYHRPLLAPVHVL